MGDIASKSLGGGMVSMNCEGSTSFVGPGSMDVKIDGKNVQLLGDPMLNNGGPSGTPANAATLVGVVHECGTVTVNMGDEECPLCGTAAHGEAAKLAENGLSKSKSSELNGCAKAAVEAALAKRDDALQRALVKLTEERVAAQKAKILELRDMGAIKACEEKIKKYVERTLADGDADLGVKSGRMATMLGVAVCDDNEVYASQANIQTGELAEEAKKKGMHFPAPTGSILGGLDGVVAQPQLDISSYLPHVKNKDRFATIWRMAEKATELSRAGKTDQPFFAPGQCAGQRSMVLALEHGARVTGLTERWFSVDPNAKTSVGFRTPSNPKLRVGSFGGEQAVPPCGSCQAILGALLCPNERKAQCGHQKAGGKRCVLCG
jgi:hypothetical protein